MVVSSCFTRILIHYKLLVEIIYGVKVEYQVSLPIFPKTICSGDGQYEVFSQIGKDQATHAH